MRDLLSDIRRGLALASPEPFGEQPRSVRSTCAHVWQLERIYEKPVKDGHNIVLRATSEEGHAFAVKANLVPDQNERQFAAQKALRAVTADSVAPRYLDPDRRFFISDWCDAPLLITRMHDLDRQDCIRRAGVWLRALHRRTRKVGPRQDAELTAFRLPAPRDEDADLRLASTRLLKRRARLGILRSRKAVLHGDYQLQNLFDLGGQLLAFDRPRHRVGSVFFDVARFCAGIELHRGLAAEAGTPWPDNLTSDRRAFYAGYGAIPAGQLALHDLIEDLVLLRSWHHFHTRARISAACREKARLLHASLTCRGLLGDEDPAARPGRLASRLLRGRVWTEQASSRLG